MKRTPVKLVLLGVIGIVVLLALATPRALAYYCQVVEDGGIRCAICFYEINIQEAPCWAWEGWCSDGWYDNGWYCY